MTNALPKNHTNPISSRQFIKEAVDHLLNNPSACLQEVDQALRVSYPGDPDILMLAAYSALLAGLPENCLQYIKRFRKKFRNSPVDVAFEAIALAEQKKFLSAKTVLKKNEFPEEFGPALLRADAFAILPSVGSFWVSKKLLAIINYKPKEQEVPHVQRRQSVAAGREVTKKKQYQNDLLSGQLRHEETSRELVQAPLSLKTPAVEKVTLPNVLPRLELKFHIPENIFEVPYDNYPTSIEDFLLQYDFSRLSLQRGFDELLCPGHLRGLQPFWYQLETARKVLRQFRGRVLLADEVGLGKTIEAGLILKEYLLRGMVHRVLILTPPSLVSQWEEEMRTKFSISCVTTQDPCYRQDPRSFWTNPLIIASLALARSGETFDILAQREFDMVIVDEAHHLKNRKTKAWALVDALKKRFLLLLSATPVQNNLLELYNILTLLKPGIFKTEREFRERFMSKTNQRLLAHREDLQHLLRDVMIRNTRAVTGVALPPRQAMTMRLAPSSEEQTCYERLSQLIREDFSPLNSNQRLSYQHLLRSAGSSPAAAKTSLERLLSKGPNLKWQELCEQYTAIASGVKTKSLLEMLEKNPEEKKLIFCASRDTLDHLVETLKRRGFSFVRFDGRLSTGEKDAAIESFRTHTPILLSSESGGEGRNLQFCNTIINFDLPWNPQAIEQRIGRVHRIGQTREVFVFNLSVKGTLEDRVLEILDEKINMFQLVVGELQSIIGHLEENESFESMVFTSWLAQTRFLRDKEFAALEGKLTEALSTYQSAKALDEELFGQELEVV